MQWSDSIVNALANFVTVMLTPPVASNAMRVAVVVGACLNLINQGLPVWHGAPVDWAKFALNFIVPFLVASYSGAKARLDRPA